MFAFTLIRYRRLFLSLLNHFLFRIKSPGKTDETDEKKKKKNICLKFEYSILYFYCWIPLVKLVVNKNKKKKIFFIIFQRTIQLLQLLKMVTDYNKSVDWLYVQLWQWFNRSFSWHLWILIITSQENVGLNKWS